MSSSGEIARKAFQAAKWNYIGVALRVAIQLIAQIVLARFLGPAEFGYYSLCFMVVGLGYLVAEMGLSSAIVQAAQVDEADVQRIWTLLLLTGFIAAGLLALCAGPLAHFLGNPAAEIYLRIAAIPLLLQILSSIALGLLRKSLDFKCIQQSQLTGMIIGQMLVGFPLAWRLHNALALLIAWTLQLLVAWIMMYAKIRHRIAPSLRHIRPSLFRFGGYALTANVANWSIENLDNFFIGRFFGARTLGFYAVSYNLARYPTNHLVTTLQTVLFPASAAIQNNRPVLRTAYLAVLSLVMLLTVPIFVTVAMVSEQFVALLYGENWQLAGKFMMPLALAMPLHAITAVSGPMLWGIGRVGTESVLQWLSAASFILFALVFGFGSPLQLAWIVLLMYVIRAMLMSGAVSSALEFPLFRLWQSVQGALWLGAIAVAGGLFARRIDAVSSHLVCILSSGVMVGLLSIVFTWLAPGLVISPSLAQVLQRFSARLPINFASRIQAIALKNTR